ncbi:DUF2855 family protein [Glaciecola siphonariae]|uniref:DUF2855 family protein n=1 Tax=Glaciecola siphonariae TaxID=521012 RepID=A0ABV9M0L6_9ALTE
MLNLTQIQVKKDDLASAKIHMATMDIENLAPDEIVLSTDSFGFSANNITYAALGETMGYWGFFPADEGYGIVPVWGFATVSHSNHSEIAVGEKVFGYLPMASHLLVRAHKVSQYGFSDGHPERKSISSVYDSYVYCKQDPGYNAKREPWQLNFRPLFMTSFVLDEFVGQQLDHESLLLSSASSKTAFGTAFLLQANKAIRKHAYEVIGLTSASNKALVESLGCYDKVYTYDELNKLPNKSSWLLDFAANGSVISNIQSSLGDDLKKVTLIGATDWQAQVKPNKKALKAEIFFAPSVVKSLHQDWGQGVFLEKYAQAWKHVASALENTMHEQVMTGEQAIIDLYLQTLQGKADTKALNVLSF